MAILIKRAAAVVISKSISDQFPEELISHKTKIITWMDIDLFSFLYIVHILSAFLLWKIKFYFSSLINYIHKQLFIRNDFVIKNNQFLFVK